MDFLPAMFSIDRQREYFRALRAQTEARLLETPPFCGCSVDEILDLRYSPARPMQCTNRPQLIQKMVGQLFVEGLLEELKGMSPGALRDRTVEALYHLQVMWNLFLRLRHNRTLSATARAQTRYVRPDAIARAGDLLHRVVCSFTDDDLEECKRTIRRPFHASPLAASLYQILHAHGPKCVDMARYYALAAILLAFGLEPPGELEVVAKRLRKRVQRPSAQHMQPPRIGFSADLPEDTPK